MFASQSRKLLAAVALLCLSACVAGEAPKPEEFFSDSTLLAASIPDIEAAKKAAWQCRLGQIYKQPEMKAFIDPIVNRLLARYADCRAVERRLPAPENLGAVLLSGEIALSVQTINRGADVGAVVSFKPKDPKAFEQLLTPLFNGQPLPVDEPVPLGMGEGAPGLLYSNGRVLFATTMQLLQITAQRMGANAAPGTLAANAVFKNGRTAIGESRAWIFFNPAPLIELGNAMGRNAANPKAVISALGVDSINGLMLGLDFSNGEPVANSYIGLNGAPGGIFSLLGTKPLRKEVMQIVEEDSPYVIAGSLHFDKLVPTIRKIAGGIDPNGAKAVDEFLAQFSQNLQFDLEKDLLANIEPDTAYAQTKMDTSALFSFYPGMNGVMRIKNAAKVDDCLKKIATLLSNLMPQMQTPEFMMRVASTPYGGTTIYYLSQPLNGSPCLSVFKDFLVYGSSVNAVKRGIDQLSTGSNILNSKSFQAAIARVSGKPFDPDNLPVSLSYSTDTGSGGGCLAVAGMVLGTQTAAVAGLSEVLLKGKAPNEPMNVPPPFREIAMSAGGRAALDVLNAADVNLWPDEVFFSKYRLAHGSIGTWGEKGWQGRTEFPPPMPQTSMNGVPVVAVVAIIAAVAIPNMLRSRMAANETAALAACKAYCTAQDIYRRTDYNKDGILEYAQALRGKESLYETTEGQGDVALIDRSFANAEGGPGNATPKAGYYFKVLKAQGASAAGGKRSYVTRDHMTLGYALVAYPAQYDGTARNTFLVSNAGTIYQKDMGPETHAIVEKMTEFDPDQTWVVAE